MESINTAGTPPFDTPFGVYDPAKEVILPR